MPGTKTKIKAPKIEVIKDYEDTFRGRVRTAIKVNQDKEKPMVDIVSIDSGSYRSYCMSYEITNDDGAKQHCALDFYAAARRLGFEHSINDIARAIQRK